MAPRSSPRCAVLALDIISAEALRATRLDPAAAQRAAASGKAVAHPTRLTILSALVAADELCVCDVGWIMERSDTLVSHHLAILRNAGLASARRDGKLVLYRATDAGREVLAALLDPAEVSRSRSTSPKTRSGH